MCATRHGAAGLRSAGPGELHHPDAQRQALQLDFGGPNFDTLYATCGDKVYRRKVKVKGANGWAAPIKPGTPRL